MTNKLLHRASGQCLGCHRRNERRLPSYDEFSRIRGRQAKRKERGFTNAGGGTRGGLSACKRNSLRKCPLPKRDHMEASLIFPEPGAMDQREGGVLGLYGKQRHPAEKQQSTKQPVGLCSEVGFYRNTVGMIAHHRHYYDVNISVNIYSLLGVNFAIRHSRQVDDSSSLQPKFASAARIPSTYPTVRCARLLSSLWSSGTVSSHAQLARGNAHVNETNARSLAEVEVRISTPFPRIYIRVRCAAPDVRVCSSPRLTERTVITLTFSQQFYQKQSSTSHTFCTVLKPTKFLRPPRSVQTY